MLRPLSYLLITGVILTVPGCHEVKQKYRLRIYNDVKNELTHIAGVKITDIGGYVDDGLLLEDIFAELEIEGKGVLYLKGLTGQSFRGGGSFSVDRIDSWSPAVNREGVQRRPDTLGFGPAGEAHVLLPIQIDTVAQLVERFSDIEAVVESWPEFPNVGKIRDARGEISFSRKRFDEQRFLSLKKVRP